MVFRTISRSSAVLDEYAPSVVEQKWSRQWVESGGRSDAANTGRPTMYVLSMFPYPSGKLHMGHVRVYTITDAIARFRTMQGYDVLCPMGWDAFGLPAENAAIERGVRPHDWTVQNIASMQAQMRALGVRWAALRRLSPRPSQLLSE